MTINDTLKYRYINGYLNTRLYLCDTTDSDYNFLRKFCGCMLINLDSITLLANIDFYLDLLDREIDDCSLQLVTAQLAIILHRKRKELLDERN